MAWTLELLTVFRDASSPGLALSFVRPMAWTWELLSVFRDTSSPGLALSLFVLWPGLGNCYLCSGILVVLV